MFDKIEWVCLAVVVLAVALERYLDRTAADSPWAVVALLVAAAIVVGIPLIMVVRERDDT